MGIRTDLHDTEPQRLAAGTLEGSIQFPAQMVFQRAFGILACGEHLHCRIRIALVVIRKAVGKYLDQAQAVVGVRVSDRFFERLQAQRAGDLVRVRRVVRVQLAPMTHHPLKRVQSTDFIR